jgi:DNA-binding response OmpR family regulator
VNLLVEDDAERNSVSEWLDASADDYLIKPYDVRELSEAVS